MSVDYNAIHEMLLDGPIRLVDLRLNFGCSKKSAEQIITTLSLNYPIYEKGRGKYALLKDDDYERKH